LRGQIQDPNYAKRNFKKMPSNKKMMLVEMLKMTAERHAQDYICTKENIIALTKWES
jgi:hypothetical protein